MYDSCALRYGPIAVELACTHAGKEWIKWTVKELQANEAANRRNLQLNTRTPWIQKGTAGEKWTTAEWNCEGHLVSAYVGTFNSLFLERL